MDKKENGMKQWSKIIKNVTMLCLAFCWFLISHTGVGGWIFIPGFFFGLGGSGTVAYKFYLSINRQQRKESRKKKNKVSFNRHL